MITNNFKQKNEQTKFSLSINTLCSFSKKTKKPIFVFYIYSSKTAAIYNRIP